MSATGDAREVARLIRQRLEMDATELFLEGMTREEALRLARGRTPAPGAPPPKAPGKVAPRPSTSSSAPTPSSLRAPAPTPPQPAARAIPLPTFPGGYDELRATALTCTRCGLAKSRTQVVFSDGVVNARLVVVGEAPGANEDATGLPFVGAAGQFLDLLLACVDLSRQDSVYICNVLKCRPPGNRNPLPDEIEACSPFLAKQLEYISPRALLAVGTFAAQALIGEQKPLGRLRGEIHSYLGIPLVVTYHPAALLRNPGWTRAFWDDLQLLRQVLDAG